MKNLNFTTSIISLIIANLIPLIGALFFGWDVGIIILLYWIENLVVGFYNIIKIVLLKTENSLINIGKLFAIPFFVLHFGGFCAGHGVFILFFLKMENCMETIFPQNQQMWAGFLVFFQLLISVTKVIWINRPTGMELPVLGLFISHGISFYQNFILKNEINKQTIKGLMSQPYKRIVIMHIAIIAGAFPVMLLGSPIYLLVVLIILKLIIDIFLHTKEHKIKKMSQALKK